MWQISYPHASDASLGSYFCVKKFDFSLKNCLNKPISPFYEEAHMVKRSENTGLATNGAQIFEMYNVMDRQTD